MDSDFEIVSPRKVKEDALDKDINRLYRLPEDHPDKYAKLTVAFRELEGLDHEKRKSFMDNDLPQTTRKSVDPNQPAFSPVAEMMRQTGVKEAVLPAKVADGMSNGHSAPKETPPTTNTVDSDYEIVPPSDTESQYDVVPPQEVKQEKKGKLQTLKDTQKGYMGSDKVPTDPLAIPGYMMSSLMEDAIAPLETARDYVFGAATGKPGYPTSPKEMGDIFGAPSTDWRKNVIPAVVETLADFALPMKTPGYFTRPLAAGSHEVMAPLGGLNDTKNITLGDLDSMVAKREVNMRPAYPDFTPGPVPGETRMGDATITTPRLITGNHTEKSKYPYRISPEDGQKVYTPYQFKMGEFDSVTPESWTTSEGDVISTLTNEERLQRAGAVKNPATGRRYPVQPLGKAEPGQMDLMPEGFGGKRRVMAGDQLDVFEEPLRQSKVLIDGPKVKTPLTLEGSYDTQYGGYNAMNEGMMPAGEENVVGKVPPHYNPRKDRPKLNVPLKDHYFPQQQFNELMAEPAERGRVPLDVIVNGKKAELPENVLPNFGGKSVSAGPRGKMETGGPPGGYPPIPTDLTVGNTANGAVLPNWWALSQRDTLEQMKSMGPLGDAAQLRLGTAYNLRATGTSTDFKNVEAGLDQIFGRSGWFDRKYKAAQDWKAGENSFIIGMQRRWNISQAETENLFNYMYTQGKIPAVNEKITRAARLLYEQGTYPVSSHPGVRMLHYKNPFTGEWETLGDPSMFMAHQPINPMAADAMNNAQWRVQYERVVRDKTKMDFQTYKSMIMGISRNDPEVTAFKFKNIEQMRMIRLDAFPDITPYQLAKRLGMENDPFRNVFRFNAMGRLRGEFALIEQDMKDILSQVTDQKAGQWLEKGIKRAMLNDNAWDFMEHQKSITRAVSRLMDASMLQLGSIGNVMQAIFPMARGGARATVRGTWDMLTGTDKALIERSGANFPNILNEINNPGGAMARYESAIMKLYAITPVDRGIRRFAGHVGNAMLSGLERNFLANPTSRGLAKSFEELGGNAAEILRNGSIPEDMRLSMIQKFANHSAGVTDVTGVPLYATTENPYFRIVNKYRTFAQANMAEIDRMIRNAPTGAEAFRRGVTLLVGAEAAGAVTNTLRAEITEMFAGKDPKRKSKTWTRWALENLAIGLATVPGIVAVQAASSPYMAVAGAMVGPVGSLVGSFVADAVSTIQKGFGWRTLDTASSRLPIVGPVTGNVVEKYKRKETKREAMRKSLLSQDDD